LDCLFTALALHLGCRFVVAGEGVFHGSE
jgi:hypothetical protein